MRMYNSPLLPSPRNLLQPIMAIDVIYSVFNTLWSHNMDMLPHSTSYVLLPKILSTNLLVMNRL